jgi:hypothetical protein
MRLKILYVSYSAFFKLLSISSTMKALEENYTSKRFSSLFKTAFFYYYYLVYYSLLSCILIHSKEKLLIFALFT